MIARIWHGYTSPEDARQVLSGFDAKAQHYEIIDETIYL
jgi:hypothetical protein